MVTTIPVGQAEGHLVELLRDLGPDDQIVLTEGGRLIARIVPEGQPATARRPGACKGMLEFLDERDDAMLEHFKAYLP
jgi:antitoxin (DNA-binding transcriptional repressor) of toxin-antitoxin stability system